jgi:hypothetical protein
VDPIDKSKYLVPSSEFKTRNSKSIDLIGTKNSPIYKGGGGINIGGGGRTKNELGGGLGGNLAGGLSGMNNSIASASLMNTSLDKHSFGSNSNNSNVMGGSSGVGTGVGSDMTGGSISGSGGGGMNSSNSDGDSGTRTQSGEGGGGRMTRSSKGGSDGKLLRMLNNSTSNMKFNKNQLSSSSSSEGVQKPNVYGNVTEVASVHMKRMNKLRHMGY